VARLAPGVDEPRAVAVVRREPAALPERLVEVGVEHLEQVAVDVREEVFLRPFQPELVLLRRVRRVQCGSLHICAPPGVVGGVGPPVESGGDDVVPALRIRMVVSAGLHDINLSGQGPGTVCSVDGQHPDGGPQPVAGG